MTDRIPTNELVTIRPPDTTPLPATTPLSSSEQPTTRRLPPLGWREQAGLVWRIWRDRAARAWPSLLIGAGLATIVLALALALAPTGAPEHRQIAAPAPTPPLVVPTAGPALPAGLVAYDAPGGAPLGELPAGGGYVVLAQAHGGAWLQLEAGTGPIWVEAANWGEAPMIRPAALADLTPPTPVPAPVIVVEYQYVDRPAVTAAPAPLRAEAPPADWPGVPFVLDPPVPAQAQDCPLVLAPDKLAECLAGQARPVSYRGLAAPAELQPIVEIEPAGDGGTWTITRQGEGRSRAGYTPPPGAASAHLAAPVEQWGAVGGGGGGWDD